MKGVLITLIVLVSIAIGTSFVRAQVGIPFGGMVGSLITCDEGEYLYLGPPNAGTYMWAWGNLQYETFTIPHPGQYLLGQVMGVLTCTIYVETIGTAQMILFHGSGP